MTNKVKEYETEPGQLVNLDKSTLYVHEKTHRRLITRINFVLKIRQDKFPFIYLECPIFYSRNKIIYYDNMIQKISKRVQSWQEKMFSFGGRA